VERADFTHLKFYASYLYEFLDGSALIANNEHCFFGTEFTNQLLVMRTRRTNGGSSSNRSSSSSSSSHRKW